MQQLESNRNLNPDQVQMLNYLKSQFALMQQQQKAQSNQMAMQQPQAHAYMTGQFHKNSQARVTNVMDNGHMGLLGGGDCLPHDLENVNPIMNPSSMQDLNFLLSRHDIAEDLRNTDGLDHILAFNSNASSK